MMGAGSILQRFVSRQLALPSGWFGRLFTARWLEKNNVGMNELTLSCLDLRLNDRLLEVGFGSGYLLNRVLSANACEIAYGVELSPEMLALATKRFRRYVHCGKVDLRHGTIDQLPYEDGSLTKLCSVNTLYFWPDADLALRECRRVLAVDGKMAICFNAKADLAGWPGHVHGFTLYELDEVVDLFVRAGFSDVKVEEARDEEQGLFYCVAGTVV
jgi:SAM-dependent methyltransferase